MYNYLFYKSYQLAKRSKNFEDAPVLGGIWAVIPCFMFNIFTLMFLIDAFFQSDLSHSIGILKYYKYILAVVLVLSLLFYYRHKNRWKKIISKYETKEAQGRIKIHPIIVLVIAYVLSSAMLMLSGMYKNGDLF